ASRPCIRAGGEVCYVSPWAFLQLDCCSLRVPPLPMSGAVTHPMGMCGLVSLHSPAIVRSTTGRLTRMPRLKRRPLNSTHRSTHPHRNTHRHRPRHRHMRILIPIRTRCRTHTIPIRPDTMADLGYTWGCHRLFLTSALVATAGMAGTGIKTKRAQDAKEINEGRFQD